MRENLNVSIKKPLSNATSILFLTKVLKIWIFQKWKVRMFRRDSKSFLFMKKQPHWKLTSGEVSKTLTAGWGSFSLGCWRVLLLNAILYQWTKKYTNKIWLFCMVFYFFTVMQQQIVKSSFMVKISRLKKSVSFIISF